MSIRDFACSSAIAALTVTAGFGIEPARADDTEVFFPVTTSAGGKANVLFILDTSQSMYTVEDSAAPDPYDPNQTYSNASSGCDGNAFYWGRKNDPLPDCKSNKVVKLSAAQFDCPTWRTKVEENGLFTDARKVAQGTPKKNGYTWTDLAQKSLWTVCQGDTTGSTPGLSWNTISTGEYTFYDGNYLNYRSCCATGAKKYRIDVVREAVGRVMTRTAGIRVGLMRFGYDGSVVWRDDLPDGVCEVVPNPIEGSRSSNGAPVVFPVTDLTDGDGNPAAGLPGFKGATVLDQLRYQLGLDAKNQALGWRVNKSTPASDQPFQVVENLGDCPLPLFNPGGRSPIGGAMHEAYLYYSGKKWSQKYGEQNDFGSGYNYPSVPQSRNGEIYNSPIQDGCAKNFIVLLTDGTTEQDNEVDVGQIEKLVAIDDSKFKATGSVKEIPFDEVIYTDAERLAGASGCDKDLHPPKDPSNPPPSECVDDIAEFMYKSDMRPINDCSKCTGINNVITYTVGFKLDEEGEEPDPVSIATRELLSDTAMRGGGDFYEAKTAQQLEDVFTDITRKILSENTSFSAPAVTVNAFNRTQNLNDLYMSLFRPAYSGRWLGNIKKYRLTPTGLIVDAEGREAVDPTTGFFKKENVESLWSNIEDNDDITLGGAASMLTLDRDLYTNLKSNSSVALANGANDVADLTDADSALLGIQAGDTLDPDDPDSGALTVAHLKDWLIGVDVANGTGNARKDMGDPLHSRPQTVIYGGEVGKPDLNDAALFVLTNDGFLHAIDPNYGTEYWAFVPRDLLKRTRDLYYNAELDNPWKERSYGLDGNIRVLRIDHNRNGIIESKDSNGKTDQVILYFGQRRGGYQYFAVDVSNKDSPKLLWSKDYRSAMAGESWSTPVPAKVRIKIGAAIEEKQVIFFGGGYDRNQDTPFYANDDQEGRGVYMADAFTGELLWRAGPDSGANLVLPDMKFSMPADVRVIDLTADGFADRIYAADLGGQIWRFDIFNGQPAGSSSDEGQRLVEGGLLASLGEAGATSPSAKNALRFFFAPDPAIVKFQGTTFINVAIGSGHRELPVSDTHPDYSGIENWFFSVRDYLPFQTLTQSQYKADCGGTVPCHELVTEEDLADLTTTVGVNATQEVSAINVLDAAGNITTARSAGWKILMEDLGEKVLAESRTFPVKLDDGSNRIVTSVLFTSFTPTATCPDGYSYDAKLGDCVNEKDPDDKLCGVGYGLNRLYAVNAVDARPVQDLKDSETTGDRSTDLAQGGIAPEVVLVFPTPDPPKPGDANPPRAVSPVCLVGLENCGTSIANPPVRTYWRQRGAN